MLKTYTYHTPSAESLVKIRKIRKMFSDLHQEILASAVDSRERSAAFTQLETAAMWANKAIVMNNPGSVAEDFFE
ncbi:MAG: hypothetical protein HC888_00725 [Candidatus Competibacteraceae bacterium]|nr:hypothetical protein [Candidatus Competibacteraceae bacterium]